MPRYAAFLRGINVTGTRVTKDDLCTPFTALGFENVTTFRASGNVIFDAPRSAAETLRKKIEKQLADDLGFDKAITYVRTKADLERIADEQKLKPKAGQKVQVMLLLDTPPESVLDFATKDDQLALGSREVFWMPKAGLSDSELDLKRLHELTGPATVRTQGTIDQIYEKYFA